MPNLRKRRFFYFLALWTAFILPASLGYCNPTINWPNNSISMSDLQGLFQSQGANALNIQFPNQSNWNVSASQLQAISNNYQQQGQSLGIANSQLPALSFSSLSASGIAGDVAMVAIDKIKNDGFVQSQITQVLNQWQNELDINNWMPDWVPDWLKNILVSIYNDILDAFSTVWQQIKAKI